MLKALFVDDSGMRLEKVKRSVDLARLQLGAIYAHTQAEAEEAWNRYTFDVAVFSADGVNGEAARTMAKIEEDRPDVARLLLTDDANVRSWTSPHMVLSPRLSVQDLNRAMIGAARWKGRLAQVNLAQIVAGARKLPSLPEVFMQIQEELRSPDPSVQRIGQIIATDPALGLTVLRVVNSSMFSLRQEVGDIVQATAFLGMRTISSLVLSASLYSTEALDRKLTSKMWEESVGVGALARQIAKAEGLGRELEEEAQLAGLLHDVGDIVLLQHWPKKFLEVEVSKRDEDERNMFGATHADIGAYLCAVWGLPSGVVDAVGYHHQPSAGANPKLLTATTAVHIARVLYDHGADAEPELFDREHLQHVVDVDRIDAWRQLLVVEAA